MAPVPHQPGTNVDPHDWRPVRPRSTRRPPEITDPVLEPFWTGTRVLAHYRANADSDSPPQLDLIDERGDPANDIAPAAMAALRDSVMALEAVIDGVLTDQPTRGGLGTALIPDVRGPRVSMFMSRSTELTYQPRRPIEGEESTIAFVAVDLLSVDGHLLLDLPLLERKRQLESLFIENSLVRVSPIARPPIGPWLNSWQAAGFRGIMMKAANSRYRPGDLTVEWTIVSHPGRGG